jgi:hypothetical protein
MSDDMKEHGCDAHQEELPELALGVLTGRDRVQALAHVESCPRCAEELEQLSHAADAVVQVAPEVEPPLGFETRLFERMGIADVRPRRRIRPRWVAGALAAAAAVAALVVGLSLGQSSPTPPTQGAQGAQGAHEVATADLVDHGTVVGRVATHGGAHPWVSMMLFDSSARGRVNCVVVTSDGARHQVGWFDASDDGYGAWIAPLSVKPQDVRSAEVVTPSGTVIATATLG